MLNKIFPLCEFHDKIVVYIQTHSNFEFGLVSQAVCNALRFMEREYVLVINMLDAEFEKGNLNLQKFWFYIQSTYKIFESLNGLVERLENKKGGAILSSLYQFLVTATDQQILQIYYFLLHKAIYPFLEMLGKWIYYGLIEDQFDEFMIVEKGRDVNNKDNFDWDERYKINDENVPSFLQRQAERILSTGKYLNVIIAYDKSRQCPYSSDLLQNLEEYLQKQ